MVALEEWLAAIEEDYQTFLTLPTPFTGNKYWRPAKPIEKWDNYSYQLLIDCQPCKAFQELREQIDADLAEFDVAPDYFDILKQIEDHHHWARTKVSRVSPDDPKRLWVIDSVHGEWQQIQRLADVLQDFVYPFGNAERARPGKRQADFFASFYGGIITLCNWLTNYDQKAQQYRRSCRERANTIHAERLAYQIQAGIATTDNEPVYTTSPEGDLKNHELCQGFMLRLEIVAQLLGQLVSLRFPVLAKRFSLLKCVPEIPINRWKESEAFPFGKLKDELQQVLYVAQVRRHEAAKMKDTPEEATSHSLPPIAANSLKLFGKRLNRRLLKTAEKYPDLQLVAVYGGNAFTTWPTVPGRVSGELSVGLWQQDWRNLLGVDDNFAPPIKSFWLAIEGKLWEAFFYFARKPKKEETPQLLDQYAQTGFGVFEHLIPIAASHLGISPCLADDDSKSLPFVEQSSLLHRWMERLFSTPGSFQQTEQPNDFTVRKLNGDVFMASSRLFEALNKAALGNGRDNKEGEEQIGVESKKPPPKRKRQGRPAPDPVVIAREEEIVANWNRERDLGAYKGDFAKSIKMSLPDLDAIIERVNARKRRSNKT